MEDDEKRMYVKAAIQKLTSETKPALLTSAAAKPSVFSRFVRSSDQVTTGDSQSAPTVASSSSTASMATTSTHSTVAAPTTTTTAPVIAAGKSAQTPVVQTQTTTPSGDPLPKNWISAFSKTHQATYYYNTVTQTTQWTIPTE